MNVTWVRRASRHRRYFAHALVDDAPICRPGKTLREAPAVGTSVDLTTAGSPTGSVCELCLCALARLRKTKGATDAG
jgi:hypothetical protein